LGIPISGLNFSGMIFESITSNNDILMEEMYVPERGTIGIGFRFLVIVIMFAYMYLVVGKSKERN